MHLAFEDAGLSLKDFQGQGLGVTIPTAYPQPFWPEEVAEILGITPGFLLGGATMGQLLSLPMIAFGLYFIWRSRRMDR